MTEEEWLAERNRSQYMIWSLLQPGKVQRTKAGKRKLRLFACGCCRMIWHLLDNKILRPALEAAERFANGEADKDEIQQWYERAQSLLGGGYSPEAPGVVALTAAHMVADACLSKAGSAAFGPTCMELALAGHSVGDLGGEAILCHLLRDVFGNPFRPAVMNREWVEWNDRSLEAVARSIYQDRAFDRMPILGDALEDAGCDDETILAHCRGPGPHIRGCWVVDRILTKG